MARAFGIVFASAACLAPLAGCVVYEPVPAYYPPAAVSPSKPAPTFDRAWNAALDALKDTGVRVTATDPATGVIRGAREQTDLLLTVSRQPDGTIQVEIEAKRPQGRDAGLASRISDAYQRRMGL